MSVRNRRVFISDIHMGIGEGLIGPHPFGWFREDRAKMLVSFLDSLDGANAVDELVVVGDLFDEWVMPFVVSAPAENDRGWFTKVAEVPENRAVLNALSQLAERAVVSYVHGNHDMQMTQEILTALAPGVRFMPGQPGRGVYTVDGIHAEHGSLYCLFNAPYLLAAHQDQQIPLGYLVARSNADFVSQGGSLDWEDYLKLFADIMLALGEGKELAQAFADSLTKVMGIKPDTEVNLYGVDAFGATTTTVKTMAEQLGDVYEQWDNEWKKRGINNVPATWAAIGDSGHLSHAAKLNFTASSSVVIYGHTHQWALHGVTRDMLPHLQGELAKLTSPATWIGSAASTLNELFDRFDPGDKTFDGHIYANTGTWIHGTGSQQSSHPATFVEVTDSDEQRTVTVNEYRPDGSTTPLKHRSIRRS